MTIMEKKQKVNNITEPFPYEYYRLTMTWQSSTMKTEVQRPTS